MNHPRAALLLAIFATFALLAACGGGVQPGARDANEVTSAGLKQTFAGKNKCNPDAASRPFVIEWDATDASSFQSRAASDVVFVRYVGCDLEIIDGCVDESVHGRFGSYKPVEWTSGALEALDINNDGDLYTKLPLGASSLAGRVEGGEKFHMEYFVSGTRNATRGAVHRGDLAQVAACKSATHFVSGYNLGAFAIGAQSNLKVNAGGSAFGFGGGGDRNSSSKADKQGGLLSSCRGDSAKEQDTCKVPIRLTLRAIDDGASDAAQAAAVPETPEAHSLAAQVQAASDREHQASAFYSSATDKMRAGDGAGCVSDLDAHDRLDPRPQYLSTSPMMGMTRGQCLMLAGQCAAGKALVRKTVSANAQLDAEQVDAFVERSAADSCRGAAASPRDELLRAAHELNRGTMTKIDAAQCRKDHDTVKKLLASVQPSGAGDSELTMLPRFLRGNTVACLARAGDCAGANQVWKSDPDPNWPAGMVRPAQKGDEAVFAGATQHRCTLE